MLRVCLKYSTHAECALKTFIRMLSEHAVQNDAQSAVLKSHNFRIFKIIKTQRVKNVKKSFWRLANGHNPPRAIIRFCSWEVFLHLVLNFVTLFQKCFRYKNVCFQKIFFCQVYCVHTTVQWIYINQPHQPQIRPFLYDSLVSCFINLYMKWGFFYCTY
jgi:hypothetical protein